MTTATLARERTMSERMEFHEYAEFFPLMEGDEFAEFVEDIRENGLLEPIVTYRGKILDGRNRYRACQEAGVEPEFTEYEGDSPLTYIISTNIHRRHLNESQRAVIVTEPEVQDRLRKEAAERMRRGSEIGAAISRGETLGAAAPHATARRAIPEHEKGEWTEHAARAAGVSRDTVSRVARVRREAPELVEKIKRAEPNPETRQPWTAKAAEREVRKRKARESAARERARASKKKRQEDPREVKAYLEALRAFRGAAREAVDVAAYGKFSPEAQRFVKRWHEDIRGLLAKVEEGFDA